MPTKRTDASEPPEEPKKTRKKDPPRNVGAVRERHAKVIEGRSKGHAWPRVCEDSGLSIGQAKKVWKRFVDEGKLTVQETDPIAVVFEQLARLDIMIEELADISAESDHAGARVGAIKVRSQIMSQQVELLQAVGLVPKNLGKLQIELENRYVVQQLMVFIDKYVPDEQIQDAETELLKLFRRVQAPQLALSE